MSSARPAAEIDPVSLMSSSSLIFPGPRDRSPPTWSRPETQNSPPCSMASSTWPRSKPATRSGPRKHWREPNSVTPRLDAPEPQSVTPRDNKVTPHNHSGVTHAMRHKMYARGISQMGYICPQKLMLLPTRLDAYYRAKNDGWSIARRPLRGRRRTESRAQKKTALSWDG